MRTLIVFVALAQLSVPLARCGAGPPCAACASPGGCNVHRAGHPGGGCLQNQAFWGFYPGIWRRWPTAPDYGDPRTPGQNPAAGLAPRVEVPKPEEEARDPAAFGSRQPAARPAAPGEEDPVPAPPVDPSDKAPAPPQNLEKLKVPDAKLDDLFPPTEKPAEPPAESPAEGSPADDSGKPRAKSPFRPELPDELPPAKPDEEKGPDLPELFPDSSSRRPLRVERPAVARAAANQAAAAAEGELIESDEPAESSGPRLLPPRELDVPEQPLEDDRQPAANALPGGSQLKRKPPGDLIHARYTARMFTPQRRAEEDTGERANPLRPAAPEVSSEALAAELVSGLEHPPAASAAAPLRPELDGPRASDSTPPPTGEPQRKEVLPQSAHERRSLVPAARASGLWPSAPEELLENGNPLRSQRAAAQRLEQPSPLRRAETPPPSPPPVAPPISSVLPSGRLDNPLR